MQVNLVKGEAELSPKPGRSFDPTLIPKAIEDAGFSVPEVTITADGTLIRREQWLELKVPGLNRPFRLAGGAQAETIERQADLPGKKVRITGKVHAGSADRPPRLTVENFRASP